MKASAYEVFLHLLASAATGGISFLAGMAIGWIVWNHPRRNTGRISPPGGAG